MGELKMNSPVSVSEVYYIYFSDVFYTSGTKVMKTITNSDVIIGSEK